MPMSRVATKILMTQLKMLAVGVAISFMTVLASWVLFEVMDTVADVEGFLTF
ncbi:hypothetical protein HDU67_009833 [Dinochytrium kinnereticum]|nr:hypothetical protein HDU67_009833 [Dinochytrium kinnereticum]